MGPRIHIPSLVLMMCLGATPFASSQDGGASSDFHTREDQARRLYAISAFAHGHRHGYEEGFRIADLEIHVGRLERTLREADVPKADYKKEYGDRKQFQQGYMYGFMTGYKDSFSNRSFRLVEWSDAVPPFDWMADMPQAEQGRAPDARLRANFEDGIVRGYQAGMNRPGVDADVKALAAQAGKSCGEQDAARRDGYCDGYTQGFLLGVNDHTAWPAVGPATEPGLAQNSSHPASSSQ